MEAANVSIHRATPNNSDEINHVIDTVEPDVCIFDRFVTEEMFGHYVHNRRPDCLRVVGMCC